MMVAKSGLDRCHAGIEFGLLGVVARPAMADQWLPLPCSNMNTFQ